MRRTVQKPRRRAFQPKDSSRTEAVNIQLEVLPVQQDIWSETLPEWVPQLLFELKLTLYKLMCVP